MYTIFFGIQIVETEQHDLVFIHFQKVNNLVFGIHTFFKNRVIRYLVQPWLIFKS